MSAAFPNGRLAARYLRALTLAGGDEHVAAAYTASQRWVEGEQLQTDMHGHSFGATVNACVWFGPSESRLHTGVRWRLRVGSLPAPGSLAEPKRVNGSSWQ